MPRVAQIPRRALLAAPAAACAPPPPPILAARGPATETLFVVQRDWHTDIGLLVRDLGPGLGPLAADWRAAESLVVGFGERAYLMTRGPGLAEMASALLPGPGALVVTGLSVTPAAAFPDGTVALRVDPPGMAALQDALAASFARDAAGTVEALRDGPHAGARYYAAAARYSAAFTCNTWTAALLRAAGLAVDPTGVVFAGQVMAQVRRIAAAG